MKRFKREGSKVWLLAENPEFAPIEVDLKEQELKRAARKRLVNWDTRLVTVGA